MLANHTPPAPPARFATYKAPTTDSPLLLGFGDAQLFRWGDFYVRRGDGETVDVAGQARGAGSLTEAAGVAAMSSPAFETFNTIDEVQNVIEPHHADEERVTAPHQATTSTAPVECPMADFILPTEYEWSTAYFAAEKALKEYLKDSHADY